MLAARAIDGRSQLYRWTREHYAELASARASYRPVPTWQAVAGLAAEAGLLDSTGKPPSAAAMRKVFARVEKDISACGSAGLRASAASRAPAPAPVWRIDEAPRLPPSRTPASDDAGVRALDQLAPPAAPRLVLKPGRVPAPGDPWKDDGSTLPKPLLPNPQRKE